MDQDRKKRGEQASDTSRWPVGHTLQEVNDLLERNKHQKPQQEAKEPKASAGQGHLPKPRKP